MSERDSEPILISMRTSSRNRSPTRAPITTVMLDARRQTRPPAAARQEVARRRGASSKKCLPTASSKKDLRDVFRRRAVTGGAPRGMRLFRRSPAGTCSAFPRPLIVLKFGGTSVSNACPTGGISPTGRPQAPRRRRRAGAGGAFGRQRHHRPAREACCSPRMAGELRRPQLEAHRRHVICSAGHGAGHRRWPARSCDGLLRPELRAQAAQIAATRTLDDQRPHARLRDGARAN